MNTNNKLKLNLDTHKASKLRNVINSDNYAYKYDIDNYYKICTIMDRLEDTVEILNNFTLQGYSLSSTAVDFIAWINYADMLVNCIKELNRMYVQPNNTTLFEDANIRLNEHVKQHHSRSFFKNFYNKRGNDDGFFRYIRSIVLAHALVSDSNQFKDFHKGKYVYTPLVRWGNAQNIIITYYSPQSNSCELHTEKLDLDVLSFFKYIESRFSYLDMIFEHIYLYKSKVKEYVCEQFKEALCFNTIELKEKLLVIKEAYASHGDLEAKNRADSLSRILQKSWDLLNFNYSSNNSVIIEKFKKLMNSQLDDLAEKLKTQTLENAKIYNLYHSFDNFNQSVFFDCEYALRKIMTEYDSIYLYEEYMFNDLFEVIKRPLQQIVEVTKSMSSKEKAYLCVIARSLETNNLLS